MSVYDASIYCRVSVAKLQKALRRSVHKGCLFNVIVVIL